MPENNTITVDVQLVGVNLVSEYKNCVGRTRNKLL